MGRGVHRDRGYIETGVEVYGGGVHRQGGRGAYIEKQSPETFEEATFNQLK